MPSFSYTLQADIINWLKGSAFPTAPTGLKLGLLTTAPNADGTGVVEPNTGAGYGRQDLTLGAITTSAGVSTVKNASPLVFGPATADWPAVTYGAVFDQAGNLLIYGPLNASRLAPSGDSISFGANAVQFRLR